MATHYHTLLELYCVLYNAQLCMQIINWSTLDISLSSTLLYGSMRQLQYERKGTGHGVPMNHICSFCYTSIHCRCHTFPVEQLTFFSAANDAFTSVPRAKLKSVSVLKEKPTNHTLNLINWTAGNVYRLSGLNYAVLISKIEQHVQWKPTIMLK